MSIHDTVTNSVWDLQTFDTSIVDNWNKINLIKFLNEHDTKPSQKIIGNNVITQAGLREIALRNLPNTVSPTRNTHHAVGTGTRLEGLSDTVLQAEVGRKAIVSSAEFAGAERYASFFARGDVGNQDRQITEAGIFTAATDGILFCRFTTTQPLIINIDDTLTISTTISHINGTQIP